MNLSDLKPGDEVKNGRTDTWGKVDRLLVVDGVVRSICVYRRVGFDRWHHRPSWWDVRNIVMAELKR